mgnify:CR=1 FL=1
MAHHDSLQPSLTALRVFTTVGRLQNVTAAAQELGISKGAVSQHLNKLEQQLATKLFERASKPLQLTEEGRFYLADLRRAFDLIEQSTQRLSRQQREWVLSCTPTFAECWLMPRLASLQTVLQRPIRVIASPQRANFVEDGVDVAIRQANPPFSIAHTAHLLLQRDWVLVCHQRLHAEYQLALAEQRHSNLTFIGDSHHFEALLPHFSLLIRHMHSLRFSTAALSMHACVQGLGMCLIDRFFIREHLAAGTLQVLHHFPEHQQDAFYLLYDQHKPLAAEVLAWFKQQN